MGSTASAESLKLSQLVNAVYQTRAELRASGADDRAVDLATEKLVRAYWGPLVPDERDWPGWFSAPRCAYCDGTGLVIRRVVNRLRILVDEGVPCRCPKGARFLPPIPREDDHISAGKTPKKSWSRAGR